MTNLQDDETNPNVPDQTSAGMDRQAGRFSVLADSGNSG